MQRWFAGRTYKSGTGWCLFRWTDVPTGYIVRLHLIKTALKHGLGAICLHWLVKPDPEPYHHDHPVSFISFILKGWYDEFRWEGGSYVLKRRRWINIIRASSRHVIVGISPGGCTTLCIMGPKVQDWGFFIPKEHAGKVLWKDYNRVRKSVHAAHAANPSAYLNQDHVCVGDIVTALKKEGLGDAHA